jgi:diguanylate cyclase (GGDEF)-like protein/PAS domain S-box-containing protein
MGDDFYNNKIQEFQMRHVKNKIFADDIISASEDLTVLTGLKINDRLVSEILSGIRIAELNWIDFYGNFSINSGKEEFELIFDTNLDVMLTIRFSDGLIINANKEFTKLLGYTYDEFIGKSCNGLNLYENHEEQYKAINETSEKGSYNFREVTFRRKDESFFSGLMSSRIVMLSAGHSIFNDVHNIIEQKWMEEKEDIVNELKEKVQELAFQTVEKSDRAAELIIAKKELFFQNEEKDNRATELVIANKELAFQTQEKADRAAELVIANKELILQNEEKDNRAAELVIANQELALQTEEKANRAAELIIANKELVFQNEEKDKRAAELVITNQELVFQNEEIKYLIFHDQLTGLYNRRYYEEELSRLDTKQNLPLTIIVGDVNGLKMINDSFGHAMGDELLKKSAKIIKRGCRVEDVISRNGGDVFVILLPRTSAVEAEGIINRINELSLLEKVGSIDISISFGYETKVNVEDEIQEVIKKADKHMYNNKLFESPSLRGRTVELIIKTLHEKNNNLETHSQRVSKLCESMGVVLGLSEYKVKELKKVGFLHDIGKIDVDEKILNKPGKLTAYEWKEIKRHPEIGYRILSTSMEMSKMAEYVLAHHERWDGKGYPRGLKGVEIPFQSRIIAIVDAYDAMSNERTYRSPMSDEAVLAELKKNSGIQFDPELVNIFIENNFVNN